MFHRNPINCSRLSRVRSQSLAIFCAGAATVGALASPGAASAALISTGACNNAALTTPFARWGDSNSYEALPGGSFEGGIAGWSTSGSARLVEGSEPYGATGSAGSKSLQLAPGSSIESPTTCVNASYPTFRFFARDNGLLSTVLVTVTAHTQIGNISLPLGVVALSSSWQPTSVMLTNSVVAGLLSGGTGQISLRFTALTGNSQIDDVFVDPRMTH